MNAMKPVIVVLWGLLLSPVVLKAEEAGKPAAVQEEGATAENAGPQPEFAPEDTDQAAFSEDPFANAGRMPETTRIPLLRGKELRTTLRVRLEVWEIEPRMLASQLDAIHGSDALEAWRGKLLADEGIRLVHSPVIAVEAKSRSSSESILERIYPTEYEPPEPIKSVSADPKRPKLESLSDVIETLTANATPTSFETRNTGTTFQVAAQPVEAEGQSWDLSLSLEEVLLVAMEHHGAEALGIKEPAISCFRTGGLLRMKEGTWQILSAQEPPRGLDAKPTGKSWLTLVRVDRAR